MALVPSFIPGAENIRTLITDFLEGGVPAIESIRRINYSTSYLWTLDFIDTNGFTAPAPFDRFFPALDISLNLGTGVEETFDAGQTQLILPKSGVPQSIDMTFYDDTNRSLQRWMEDWIKLDLQNDGQFMSGLRDNHQVVRPDLFGNGSRQVRPLRQVKIALLNGYREEALVYFYSVYPSGPLILIGNQSSEATQFQMRFNIYEELAKPRPEQRDTFDTVKRIIGQSVGRFV